MLWETILCLCPLLLIWHLLRRKKRSLSDFTGPRGWPLLGNALQLNIDEMYKTFTDWETRFGKCYKINLFGREALVLSSEEAVHEALVKKGKDFSGRDSANGRIKLADQGEGVALLQPTKEWKEIRKSCHKSLKMYDSGMDKIEQMSLEVVEEVISDISKHGEKEFDIKPTIYKAMVNFMMQFLVGKKYHQYDPVYDLALRTEHQVVYMFKGSVDGLLLDALPITRYLGARDMYRNVMKFGELSWELIRTLMEEVETSPDKDKSVVHHMTETTRESENIREKACQLTWSTLITAGISTTTQTLYCMINILLNYPCVYAKLQREIDQILGSRKITLHDREKMPYLSSCLNEVLRYSSIVPFLIPHTAVRDTVLQGKVVHEGTLVFCNVWSLHHDPDIYPEPWVFKPERFLDEDGTLLPADHSVRRNLYAFGAGPRVCLGEIIARTRLFLVVGSVLQKFEFKAGQEKVSCDPRDYIPGVPLYHKPYKVRAVPRII